MTFETETCGRCGGSGEYSYCQSYGTTCFKCSGKRKILTKRGQRANNLYASLLKKPVGSLKPGDKVLEHNFFAGKYQWCEVAEIKPAIDPKYLDIRYTPESGMSGHRNMQPSERVRVAASKEQKQGAWEIALAYQSILGKNGKEPKWLSGIAW
jgi:hypothetical protein